jgi:hypothetical protein
VYIGEIPEVSMDPATVKPGVEPSLAHLVDSLRQGGFPCPLEVRPDTTVRCPTCNREGPAGELKIVSYRRFEGVSDPEDMSFVAAVHWPNPNAPACQGVLVLGFGPLASPEDKAVLSALQFEGSPATPIA